MEASLPTLPRILLGALLFSACSNHGGLRVLDAYAGPAGDATPSPEASTTSAGMEAGGDNLATPDGKSDGVTNSVDMPAQLCGNGRLDSGEECDDGNTLSGDGCSSRCKLECRLEADIFMWLLQPDVR